jgi:hypothetical protein
VTCHILTADGSKELQPSDPKKAMPKQRVRPDQTTNAYLRDALRPQLTAQYNAEQLGQACPRAVQTTDPPSPDAPAWLPLPPPPPGVQRPPTWEHASWITVEDITVGALRSAVRPDACVSNKPIGVTQTAFERC